MDVIICILNLFLVPFLSLSIWSRRRKEEVTMSGTWLVRYAVFAVFNILLSHVFTYAVRALLHRTITEGTVKYTVIAAFSAFVLPYLCDLLNVAFSRTGFHVEPRGRDGM
ncbi:MAG TPA: hypothetical protein DHV42_08285 [Lachnospiraceae bacterium]|nr:hypothetical protein [Lachnospiraceae bacterium]